ncbi:MAG: hypothetical protein K1X79_07600 [Oligoflexia bacterium]|nr:hypothetical protein [Oligoflexia bacterium]
MHRKILHLSRYLATIIGLFPALAYADLTLSTPTSGTDSMAPCQDYYRYEWNEPRDMSDRTHGALDDFNDQARGADSHSYSSGVLSLNTTSSGAALTFLQYTALGLNSQGTPVPGAIPVHLYGEEHPINSSTYTHLALRMYSSALTIATVLWSIDTSTYATTLFTAYAGWHVYDIDLSSASINSSAGSSTNWSQRSWEGLEIFPANASGVNIQIDWLQLTSPSNCGSFNVGYSVTGTSSANRLGLAIDTDTDPSNGVVAQADVALSSDGAASSTINGTGSGAISAHTLYPGDYYVYGTQSAGADWASTNLFDAWDMDSSSDIGSLTSGISGGTFSGGQYSGTFSNVDPTIYLNIPRGKSINGSVYRYLTVKMTLSGLSSPNALYTYFFDTSGVLLGSASVSGVTNGTQTIQLDLGGVSGWSGHQIGYLRIDPVDNALVPFSIDFVALSATGYVTSLSAPTLVQASTTLKVGNPGLSFIQPDKRGGIDFAQSVLGDPWNMNSSADIDNFTNVSSASIFSHGSLTDPAGNAVEGDFLRAYNVSGNGDAQYVPLNFDSAHPIDTTRFVNLCFAGWNKTETNNFNSVMRAIWHDASASGSSGYKDGDDIIGFKRNAEYCLDLRSTLDTRVEPPLADGAPNPWTSLSSGVNLLRIDMNESTDSDYYSVIDYIHLRSDHEANTQYAIVVDADLSQSVTLYYNSSASTSGGTLIGTLAGGRNTNIYLWDTSALTEGTYYIYGTAAKDSYTLPVLAEGRVVVSHSRSQDSTAPLLVCERPGNSYTFDTSLEVAGYAMDETRLATVEVLVDGNWIGKVTPNKFHLAARDAHPELAESNNPGFQEYFDGTQFSYGAHTVRIVATDTAGNETSCDNSVTRAVGQDTSPYTYPTPSNSETTLDTGYVQPDPTLSVKLKNSTLTVKATELNSCGTFTLQGATTKSFTNPVTIYSAVVTADSITKTFKKLYSLTFNKKKEDGIVYMRASCSGGGPNTSKRKVSASQSKAYKKGKKVTTETKWLTKVK